MKLTLDELPSDMESQYLLTKETMQERDITLYDVIFLLGQRSRRMAKQLFVTHRVLEEGVLITWSFNRYEG